MTDDDIEIRLWDRTTQGGQHVTARSAVVVLHRPTGLAVVVDSERSQLVNKAAALSKLAALVGQQTTGREHVERVVREELRRDFGDDYEVMLDCLARRVADRLSVPVLSEDERDRLAYLVGWCNASLLTGEVTVQPERFEAALVVLQRVAAGKP